MTHSSAPHLRVPFQISGPSALIVEGDTLEEVAQNVDVIVATRRGERLVVPMFGISDPTFRTGFDAGALAEDIAAWEPRAAVEITTGDIDSTGELDVNIKVRRI